MFILAASSVGGNRQTHGRTTLLVLSFVYFSRVSMIYFENVRTNAAASAVCVGDGVSDAAASNMSRNCHLPQSGHRIWETNDYFLHSQPIFSNLILLTNWSFTKHITGPIRSQRAHGQHGFVFYPPIPSSLSLLQSHSLALPAPTSLRCSFYHLHP